MKLFGAIHILLIAFCLSRIDAIALKDIGTAVVEAAEGVADKIPDALPNAEEFFQSAKNVIAGYPVEVVFSLINKFC